jgi:hypothetical protein
MRSTLHLIDEISPGVLRSGTSFLYVLMPMRVIPMPRNDRRHRDRRRLRLPGPPLRLLPVTVTPPGSTPPTTTAPPTPPPAPTEIPYATRIAGKPGFVKSPFDPNGQAIDVRDFQSGQKARCPYTGKIFRVP